MPGGKEFFYGDDEDGKRQDTDLHHPIIWGGNSAAARVSSAAICEAEGVPAGLVKPLLDPKLLADLRARRAKSK